ncbi:hypothetical protein AGR56_09005 [Clostridium sp. DMHC 10]|uniref:hypothetical protein n=1 Tax=Clostridium sp. DMHC 10 TaxID=747377 RepID=UPI00069F580A|nr:hypothetical protein [Clostridium sp. DMHC 10]KOF56794.1 hypothetical protein AGR56_09005 [Clostridium sp. DMHC 10]
MVQKSIELLENHEANFKNLLLNVFGIRTISEEDAKEIMDKHRPLGNYLVLGYNSYTAIDNTNGNFLVAKFLSIEKAFTFLKTEIFVEVLQRNDKKST